MGNKSIADFFSDFRSESLVRKYRFEAACDGVPGLTRVREGIARAGLEKLERALRGESEDECDARLEALAKEEAAILARVGEPRYNCARCKDSGMKSGGYCSCLLQPLYAACYGAADIGAFSVGFDRSDLSLFDDSAPLPGGKTQRQYMALFLKRAQEYVEGFPDTARKNILLSGKTGLGKSFLLQCMAKRALERGIDVMLIRAPALFSLFHAHRLGDETDLAYLYNTKLLLIDDIGTEPVTQNVSIEYFYELIEKRLTSGLHTVFATNANDLQARYDDRIASRLEAKENSLLFPFDGKDLRVK